MSATSVSGGWARLQRCRSLIFWPCKERASIERQLLTDQFTPQLMGKSRWEGGEWGKGEFGIRCTMGNLPTFHSCFCCIHCSFIQCGWLLGSPMDCSMPGSLCPGSVCSENGQWFQSSSLTCQWSCENTECDATGGNLSNMVTQELSQQPEPCMAHYGWSKGWCSTD